MAIATPAAVAKWRNSSCSASLNPSSAMRARVTREIIEKKGFNIVAAEADWPDAYRVNRFVRGASDDAEAAEALARVDADYAAHGAAARRVAEDGVSPDDLTDREREVLRRLALGESNKAIADALCVSEETVKTHVGHILAKLGVENRAQAVVQALKRGLVSLEEIG